MNITMMTASFGVSNRKIDYSTRRLLHSHTKIQTHNTHIYMNTREKLVCVWIWLPFVWTFVYMAALHKFVRAVMATHTHIRKHTELTRICIAYFGMLVVVS